MTQVLTGGNVIIQIDPQNTGVFTDISRYYVSHTSQFGFRSPHTFVADVGTCDIVVDNQSRYFSPNYSGNGAGDTNPFYPIASRAPIKMFASALTLPIFYGFIDDIIPDAQSYGQRRATIRLFDVIGKLRTTFIDTPLRYNATADKIIASIVNAAFGAAAIAGTFKFTGKPANGDTVTVTDADSNVNVFTFLTVFASAVNTVAIGATRLVSAQNLAAAIGQTLGLNVVYGAMANPPRYLVPTLADNSPIAGNTLVTLTSQLLGAYGTAFTLSSTSANITATNPGAGTDAAQVGTFDVGAQTFPYAGHGWQGSKVSALSAIDEVVTSENGRFYANTAGVFVFRNRNFIFKQPVLTATTVVPIGYLITGSKSTAEISNDVRVTITPPALSSAGIVAQITSPVQVPGNSSKTIHLNYVDPVSSLPVGAIPILPIVATTDWVANTKPNGTGDDYTTVNTGSLAFTYALSGGGIDIIVVNSASGPLYFTTLQVRGKNLTSNYANVMESQDATSISQYGLIALSIRASLSADELYAISQAGYLLSKYKQPVFRATKVTLPPLVWGANKQQYQGPYAASGTTLGIFSPVTLSDYQLAMTNEKYQIIGLSIKGSLQNLISEWVVEKLDDVTYWILEDATYGKLGITTRLAI